MTWKKDEEITELINRSSKKQRSRVTITRWRNKSRYPNYEEVREIEKNLGIPFDVLYRDVNLDELMEELQRQLKEVKRIKKFITKFYGVEELAKIFSHRGHSYLLFAFSRIQPNPIHTITPSVIAVLKFPISFFHSL